MAKKSPRVAPRDLVDSLPRVGPPEKLYKIGEVMRHSGLTRQTVHNYTMFGLLRERERTESGHRLYGEEVFAQIERIRALRAAGNSLKEIRLLLVEGA